MKNFSRYMVGNEFHDTAKVEMSIIGPMWLGLIRYRFYMSHRPDDHVTKWELAKFGKYIGSYTPPGWFLKLIGQVK